MAKDAWDALRPVLEQGREQAFAELYDRCAGPMYRVARRMLGSDADAEDAVHQAFLELLRSRHALARADNPAAYAVVTARHAALRLRSARERVGGAHTASLAAAADVAAPEGPAPARPALARALDALPAEQRDVVALKIDGALTFAEIGRELAISPNTAASRYRYALQRLRASLPDEEDLA